MRVDFPSWAPTESNDLTAGCCDLVCCEKLKAMKVGMRACLVLLVATCATVAAHSAPATPVVVARVSAADLTVACPGVLVARATVAVEARCVYDAVKGVLSTPLDTLRVLVGAATIAGLSRTDDRLVPVTRTER